MSNYEFTPSALPRPTLGDPLNASPRPPTVYPQRQVVDAKDLDYDRTLCMMCQSHNCWNCWNNPKLHLNPMFGGVTASTEVPEK